MKKTIVLGLGVLLFWSCNNAKKNSVSGTEENVTEAHAEPHYNESDGAIELNNGEKWVVNEEMKPYVSKGIELVNAYVQESKTDFKELAAQLKDQNTQLITSCTMTGKSHDELHKWLHPLLELVQNLENETETSRANEIVAQIQQSYQEYPSYFK